MIEKHIVECMECLSPLTKGGEACFVMVEKSVVEFPSPLDKGGAGGFLFQSRLRGVFPRYIIIRIPKIGAALQYVLTKALAQFIQGGL
jgi:hypothetical protein